MPAAIALFLGHVLVGDRAWVHADRAAGAEGHRVDDQLEAVHHAGRAADATRHDERQQAAAGLHLALGQFVLRMGRAAPG